MNLNNEKYLKLEKALIKAYEGKKAKNVDSLWQLKVMNDIQSLASKKQQQVYNLNIEKFAWRFVALSAAASIILFLMNNIFVQGYDLSQLFMYDPIGYSWYALLNI